MAVTIRQKAASTGDPSGTSTSQTATFAGSTLSGSLIAAFISHEGTAVTLGGSATGDSFTLGTKRTHTNTDLSGQWIYKLASAGGWTAFTASYATARPWRRIYVWEITTDNGGAWVLDTEALSAAGATGTSATSATFSTTGSGDIIALGGYKEYAGVTPSAQAIDGVGAGANVLVHDSGSSWAVAGAVTTGAATMTATGGAEYVLTAISFFAAPGGASGQPTFRRSGGVPLMGTGGLKGNGGGGAWGRSRSERIIVPRWLADQERQAA